MNKYILYVSVTLALSAAVSCVRTEISSDAGKDGNNPAKVPMTLSLQSRESENLSKTYIDGRKIIWETDDCIALYDCIDSEPNSFTVTEVGEDGSAVAEGEVTEGAWKFYASYPFSGVRGFDLDTKSMTLDLPSVQTLQKVAQTSGTVCYSDPSALVSVGQLVDGACTMKNVYGLLRFTLSETETFDPATVEYIKIKTAGESPIAGEISVDVLNPESYSLVEGKGVKSLRLNKSEDGFGAGTYNVPVLPGEYGNAFEIVFYAPSVEKYYTFDGTSFENLDVNVERNAGSDLQDISSRLVAQRMPVALTLTFDEDGASSSTLPFRWSAAGFDPEAKQFDSSLDWSVALYRDKECTSVVYGFEDILTNYDFNWNNTWPQFTFAGLAPNTTYYAKAWINDFEIESEVLAAKTSLFVLVGLESAVWEVGNIVLAEDFSECVMGGDQIPSRNYYGFYSAGTHFLSGMNPSGSFMANDVEYFLADSDHSADGCCRFYDSWSLLARNADENKFYSRPGFVKMGGESYATWLISPKFATIPQGKVIDMEVEVTMAMPTDSERDQMVCVIKGDRNYKTIKRNGSTPRFEQTLRVCKGQAELENSEGWQTLKFNLTNIDSESYLQIGCDNEKSSRTTDFDGGNHRTFLSSVTAKVTAVRDVADAREAADDGVLDILFIGNSFTRDAVAHLPGMIAAAGIDNVHLAHCYRGGSLITTHVSCWSDATEYEFYEAEAGSEEWTKTDKGQKNIEEAVLQNAWDIVVLQEHSGNVACWSWEQSDKDNLSRLMTLVKSHQAVEPEYWYLMSQAYYNMDKLGASSKAVYRDYFTTQAEMYSVIVSYTRNALKELPFAGVIASGTTLQNLRTSSLNIDNGYDLTRDGYHLDYGISRYASACTVFETLITPYTGVDLYGNTYRYDESDTTSGSLTTPVTDENAPVALQAARNAISKPFEITPFTSGSLTPDLGREDLGDLNDPWKN